MTQNEIWNLFEYMRRSVINHDLTSPYSPHDIDLNPIETGTAILLWYNKEGRLHRKDGPAKIFPDGTRAWYLDGELHREDGPAIIWFNDDKDWFIRGEAVATYWFLQKQLDCGDEQILMLRLKYGEIIKRGSLK